MLVLLAASLSVVLGLSLGLLGGGGSVLAVPIFFYLLRMDAREAIATSLLVVAVTSAASLAQHARAAHVWFRTGLWFGGFSMIGAYVGGVIAEHLPAELLLVLFALVMILTATAMLRLRLREPISEVPMRESGSWKTSRMKLSVQGLTVGAMTGLVGAGGGFVIVPALVLFAGLPMRAAIGTGLLITMMNASAGFVGHLHHVTLPWVLAGTATAAAVLGSVVGTRISARMNPSVLKTIFGWVVLTIALVMLYERAPRSLRTAVFEDRWPFWIGGIAIGLFVLSMYRVTRHMLGVSTGFQDVCMLLGSPKSRRASEETPAVTTTVASPPGMRFSWRLAFLAGIVAGGFATALLGGGVQPSFAVPLFDQTLTSSLPIKALIFTGGGALLGFGAALAGGCTSGHGIVGTALLAPSSWITTATFMASGFAVTQFLYRALGGP